MAVSPEIDGQATLVKGGTKMPAGRLDMRRHASTHRGQAQGEVSA